MWDVKPLHYYYCRLFCVEGINVDLPQGSKSRRSSRFYEILELHEYAVGLLGFYSSSHYV